MKNARKARGNSDSYFDCIRRHPLVTIRTEAELDAAMAVIHELLVRRRDPGEEEYLDALSDHVIVYEQQHHSIEPAAEAEVLHHLIEDNSLTQAEIVRKTGIAKSTLSAVLSGTRGLTKEQRLKLSEFFSVSPMAFLLGETQDIL